MDAAVLMKSATWVAIGICLSQSAFFSGMNLAVFSISRMRLEVEVASGNPDARKLLLLRKNANLLLTPSGGVKLTDFGVVRPAALLPVCAVSFCKTLGSDP